MPRFFFHLHSQNKVELDEVGRDMADLAAAKSYSRLSALQRIGGSLAKGEIDLRSAIVIVDDNGTTLASMLYRDLVRIAEE